MRSSPLIVVVETDDQLEQDQHALRPEPAESASPSRAAPAATAARSCRATTVQAKKAMLKASALAQLIAAPRLSIGSEPTGCGRSTTGRNSAARYLPYSPISSAAVPRHAHQRCRFDQFGEDRVRHDLDFRHRPLEFEQAARHVVPGGDQAQAAIALPPHPARGLLRVALGVFGLGSRSRCSRQANAARPPRPAAARRDRPADRRPRRTARGLCLRASGRCRSAGAGCRRSAPRSRRSGPCGFRQGAGWRTRPGRRAPMRTSGARDRRRAQHASPRPATGAVDPVSPAMRPGRPAARRAGQDPTGFRPAPDR